MQGQDRGLSTLQAAPNEAVRLATVEMLEAALSARPIIAVMGLA